MFKFLRERKKDNKGFTLVELVIVVAILAILVGILAPQYTKYVEKSRKAADAANLENLVTAFKTAASDGSNSIAAGKYTFKITTSGTTLENVATTEGAKNTAVSSDVEKLITSFAGDNWKTTKLKSARWLTTNADGTETTTVATEISATLEVKNDGSVNVTYSPATIKNQTNS